MNKKIRVGIAGFGVVGTRRLEFLQKHPSVQVTGICDFKFSLEKPQIPGVQVYENYRQLLEMDLDAVFVCLTNEIAPEVTIASLKKGLHVFCEKPPGRTVEDILKVREAEAQNPNLKLKYGFNHRYHGSVIRALEIVRSGELGRVINLRGVYGKSAIIPWPRKQPAYLDKAGKEQWRTDRAIAGGGILLDQGIHMVDLMRAFGGDFTEFKSFVSNSYWKHDVEDNAYALMSTKDGVVAMLHSTATQWQHRFSLDIHLSEGSLSLTGILSGSRSYGEEKLTIIRRVDEDNGVPQETVASYNRDDSWWMEIREFIDSIEKEQPIQVGSSLDALKTMETVYSIYRADEKWNQYLQNP
jgi:predicted dehydrogenase